LGTYFGENVIDIYSVADFGLCSPQSFNIFIFIKSLWEQENQNVKEKRKSAEVTYARGRGFLVLKYRNDNTVQIFSRDNFRHG
jgi:hypothetical protein